MLLFCIAILILFFLLQALVLFCCLAAGNDPASQEISDQEQLEFIAQWNQKRMRCQKH